MLFHAANSSAEYSKLCQGHKGHWLYHLEQLGISPGCPNGKSIGFRCFDEKVFDVWADRVKDVAFPKDIGFRLFESRQDTNHETMSSVTRSWETTSDSVTTSEKQRLLQLEFMSST
eukprot:TRINITY_DN104774_c0_g1_i1.p1 TRINITY_DN104774_c0_g1~~TRINITY_DN104774_c0_g1_i1.p1  ORF type:complete len:127 (+),score=17.84 TRINITY_DN104774_c0_g1_i1:36-383(+)